MREGQEGGGEPEEQRVKSKAGEKASEGGSEDRLRSGREISLRRQKNSGDAQEKELQCPIRPEDGDRDRRPEDTSCERGEGAKTNGGDATEIATK